MSFTGRSERDGKILYVDLSNQTVTRQNSDPDWERKFIGGPALSARILWDEVPPDVKPLSPDNVIVFTAGALCGTMAPSSGRIDVASVSPLTGMLGTSSGGGFFGATLAWAGFTSIVVKGKADHPVYLWIDDDKVEIRNAEHLWGKDTWRTADAIKEEHSSAYPDRVRVLSIGPAGENLVLFASITVDYHHSASRLGMGTVMGSKNLKAIAVRGTRGVIPARGQEFEKTTLEYLHGLPQFGWYLNLMTLMRDATFAAGDVAGKHYQEGAPSNFRNALTDIDSTFYRRPNPTSCHCCPRCCNVLDIKAGKYRGVRLGNWGNWAALDWGGVCTVNNLPAIGYCMRLCEQMGLDSGNCSEAIGFAMELYQRGIIDSNIADGLPLKWGHEETIIKLIHKIAHREGFGDILAEGSARAAQKLGHGAEEYAVHIRGLSPIGVDPRLGSGWSGRMLATSELTGLRGDNIKGAHLLPLYEKLPFRRPEETRAMTDAEYVADFVRKRLMPDEMKSKVYGSPPKVDPLSYDDGKTYLVKFLEDFVMVPNALGMCFHVRLAPNMYARLYSAFTGRDVSEEQILEIGERNWNFLRAFDARLGIRRDMYDWPDRFYQKGIGDGPAKGAVLSREQINGWLDKYYALRGWDPRTGIPTREKLHELDLDDVAKELNSS